MSGSGLWQGIMNADNHPPALWPVNLQYFVCMLQQLWFCNIHCHARIAGVFAVFFFRGPAFLVKLSLQGYLLFRLKFATPGCRACGGGDKSGGGGSRGRVQYSGCSRRASASGASICAQGTQVGMFAFACATSLRVLLAC